MESVDTRKVDKGKGDIPILVDYTSFVDHDMTISPSRFKDLADNSKGETSYRKKDINRKEASIKFCVDEFHDKRESMLVVFQIAKAECIMPSGWTSVSFTKLRVLV